MSWRAFAIGMVIVVVLSAFTPYNNWGLNNTYLAGNHFPVGPFFILVLLTLALNPLVRRLRRAWALHRGELMLIWCMMIAAASVAGSGMTRILYPLVAAPSYHANRGDLWWEKTVLPSAPDSLLLSKDLDSAAVEGFFQGAGRGERTGIPWREWARPLTSWGILIALFLFATFCMCAMLRKQWVESERLMFPLARVPLELSEAEEGLLPAIVRSKAFWVTAGLLGAVEFLRILPVLMGYGDGILPVVPVNRLFAGSFLRYGRFHDSVIYPLALGFALLIPARISFSLWFLHILTRFEFLGAYALGWPDVHDFSPFTKWQQTGAFIVFAASMLWMARRHLWSILRKAMGLDNRIDDSAEPLSYRAAFWGFSLSFVGMVAWSWHFGMSPLVAALFLVMMLCMLLVQTRLVSQGGLFRVGPSWFPMEFVQGVTGGYAFSAPAAVVVTMQQGMFMATSRAALSPHAMNALRISSVFGKRARLLPPLMFLCVFVGSVCAGVSYLYMNYRFGAANLFDQWAINNLPLQRYLEAERLILRPGYAEQTSFPGLLAGASVMGLLVALRGAFHWWPLHPVGFPLAVSSIMRGTWFCFLLGWLIKACALRYGGGRMVRTIGRVGLSLIITEGFVIGCCAVLGLVTGHRFSQLFLFR